jgi:hypothetical protein
MRITPDETRGITNTRCSGCGSELHVNQQAIWFDAMVSNPLLLGDCCADRVLGALNQDYAEALTRRSNTWPSYWITQATPHRMTRVAEKAKVISEAYLNAIPGLHFCSPRSGNIEITWSVLDEDGGSDR